MLILLILVLILLKPIMTLVDGRWQVRLELDATMESFFPSEPDATRFLVVSHPHHHHHHCHVCVRIKAQYGYSRLSSHVHHDTKFMTMMMMFMMMLRSRSVPRGRMSLTATGTSDPLLTQSQHVSSLKSEDFFFGRGITSLKDTLVQNYHLPTQSLTG